MFNADQVETYKEGLYGMALYVGNLHNITLVDQVTYDVQWMRMNTSNSIWT